MAFKKFEYLEKSFNYHDTWDIETKLNNLGAKGWEMCGMYVDGVDLIFYFKREK